MTIYARQTPVRDCSPLPELTESPCRRCEHQGDIEHCREHCDLGKRAYSRDSEEMRFSAKPAAELSGFTIPDFTGLTLREKIRLAVISNPHAKIHDIIEICGTSWKEWKKYKPAEYVSKSRQISKKTEQAILKALKNGASAHQTAKKYGVGNSTIARVKRIYGILSSTDVKSDRAAYYPEPCGKCPHLALGETRWACLLWKTRRGNFKELCEQDRKPVKHYMCKNNPEWKKERAAK